jgi:hypothetical protein
MASLPIRPHAVASRSQAYLDSLGDDEIPELSETDRRRKADWDQRRNRSEETEKDCA